MATVCVVGDLGPGCLNLTGLIANDRNEMVVTLMENGVPIDVTGLTFAAHVRTKATDPDPPAVVAEAEVFDGPAGRVFVRFPGSQVFDWLAGKAKIKGVWDLQQVDVGQDPLTLLGGSVEAKMDVTRP